MNAQAHGGSRHQFLSFGKSKKEELDSSGAIGKQTEHQGDSLTS